MHCINVALEWDEACHQTENVLGSTANIFNSILDDTLLFDDKDFTATRQYWWLVNSVHEFQAIISAAIHTWNEY